MLQLCHIDKELNCLREGNNSFSPCFPSAKGPYGSLTYFQAHIFPVPWLRKFLYYSQLLWSLGYFLNSCIPDSAFIPLSVKLKSDFQTACLSLKGLLLFHFVGLVHFLYCYPPFLLQIDRSCKDLTNQFSSDFIYLLSCKFSN